MIKIQNELNIQIENASIKILRFPFLRSTQRVIVLDNEKHVLAINNHTPYKQRESHISISVKRS